MKKIPLVLFVIIFIAAAALFIVKSQNKKQTLSPSASSPQPSADISNKIDDDALKNALNAYAQAKQKGTDLSNGPCLGLVASDWIADITHNPRQPVDDKEENQCSEFRSGQAKHFIELDPDGKLIRSQ